MRRHHETLRIVSTGLHALSEETVSSFLSRNWEVIHRVRARLSPPIIKLSGGEIFMLPEFMQYLPALAERYSVVQILTNGTLLSAHYINRLREIPNLIVQVSLDGHQLKHNRHRFRSVQTLSRILESVRLLTEASIPVEINTVLSSANTADFFDFVKHLAERSVNCVVYPFPVRSVPELFPEGRQIEEFQEAFERSFLKLHALLPPMPYFTVLLHFLKCRRRERPCFVPHTVISTTGDGTLDACTCGPVKRLGNILSCDPDEAMAQVGADRCYVDVTIPAISPICCQDCFTHYDIIDLFIEDQVALADLVRIPLFAAPAVLERLRLVKGMIRSTTDVTAPKFSNDRITVNTMALP